MRREPSMTSAHRRARMLTTSLILTASTGILACADPSTAPRRPAAAANLAEPSPLAPMVRVCDQGAPATFSAAATSGLIRSSVSLTDGRCEIVWRAASADDVAVTVRRTDAPGVQTDL